MDLIAVLLTGLLAGGISCAAVQGGLLTGLIARQRATSPASTNQSASQARDHATSSRLRDDIAPVGGFLAGKLISHVVLGALLGTLGSVVQLSVGARTTLQLAAGLLIIVLGLAQLGAPGLRNLVIEPPATWLRLVRRSARSRSVLAPALLGVATVLIPCGITLSVQALALASGSAVQGAAIMGVFVLGTSPLFALLGYAARRAATMWHGRLSLITGLVVVIMGLYTFNGGLELAGSPLAASRLTAGFQTSAAPELAVATVQDGRQEVVITARAGSYSPDEVRARAGIPTTLIVRADNARGCIRSFIIPDRSVDAVLPVTGDTRIDLGVLAPGSLDYSCGMGMYTGTIIVA